MSLKNTFRLLAVSVALMMAVHQAAGFSHRRTTTLRRVADPDLYPDETRTNAHHGNTAYEARNSTDTSNIQVLTKKKTNEAPAAPPALKASEKSAPKKKIFHAAVTTYRPATKDPEDKNAKAIRDGDSKFPSKKAIHLQNKSAEFISNERTREKVNEKQAPLPSWKKYTFINRNKVEDAAFNTKKKDAKVDAPEAIVSATSLKDTITADIPSLEKLKNDLLSTPTINKSKLSGQPPASPQSPSETKPNENAKGSVESKRAGYLDYSEKNKDEAAVTHTNPVSSEKSVNTNQESTNPQIKDSLIKEILLKESVNNDVSKDKEENEKLLTKTTSLVNDEIQTLEDKLLSKSGSIDKSKNASLYTVSPNYKPLKKLEVQPPKQFVRDPDDNSWRNESISSLGIVFKPKNSSKAFTQVLKNKTETEWNTLLEKDRKNDIPDLRERLELMAKMRKTKRKKVDSMGNIVYVDYEENGTSNENMNSNENFNSNENMNPLQGDIIIPLLSFDPQFLLTASKLPPSMASDVPKTEPYTTTIDTTVDKETTPGTTKPKKNYNIPDYYESSEDEDSDYLDLAKIDIKKFATQRTTQTPFDTTTWPVTSYRPAFSDVPDRAATLQFFPPLRNKKVNKISKPIYQENFVSTRKPTTTFVPSPPAPPADRFSPYGGDGFEPAFGPATDKPTTISNDIYLRQPPRFDEHGADERPDKQREHGADEQRHGDRIDEPGLDDPLHRFKVISDTGSAARGSYVIKSLDDFIGEAERDNEFDSQLEFGPQTEATSESVATDELPGLLPDLDYDAKFRKDVLGRFVENFNRNTAKFKSEFPIIFNSSIVHGAPHGSEVASSRAFLRGLHGARVERRRERRPAEQAREPRPERRPAEPTYEFHYFMPQQDQNAPRYRL